MKIIRRHYFAAIFCLGAAVSIAFIAFNLLADPPAPALTISSLGSNEFSFVITNGVSTNYELYWTPTLNDPSNYPWTLLTVGSTGQTNFSVNAAGWSVGFFRASIEQFYNGVPDYELADPNNPSLGPLTITIDSPTNGFIFN